jgi:hypothetical protein
MSSAEFRRRYASLSAPTVVTVNGRPIGVWTPGATEIATDPAPATRSPDEPRPKGNDVPAKRWSGFGPQPFSGPIPKKGR